MPTIVQPTPQRMASLYQQGTLSADTPVVVTFGSPMPGQGAYAGKYSPMMNSPATISPYSSNPNLSSNQP